MSCGESWGELGRVGESWRELRLELWGELRGELGRAGTRVGSSVRGMWAERQLHAQASEHVSALDEELQRRTRELISQISNVNDERRGDKDSVLSSVRAQRAM